ncbi:tRNA-2-methylthio-N6-dimethylallyladenosine synthase [Natranaerovirga hydrolytica]|uniref:tRNA-2-methylthio-N(6)-dimethylallyladenosine synthase n=1 Tax=Natranaerovirga hydrolytica TaxID=680378 RepID=A0A4V2Q1K9_9FIRM|nr:tRNA (N6-isopentenyl adenosine(37)-C2)-methylthiotransferase MiaB [Natranaerovirga hydrolytica]TCK98001.1 tRNA-2-methylthio-N6-dimethylallyladenosine synthase [Natranaerovirga hydrolytica]
MAERKSNIIIEESEAIRQKNIIKALREEFDKAYEKTGKKKLFFIQTYGCQMNARDSEKLKGILEEIGYVETDQEEKADFIIYNTCTVRENANQKVYGRVGHLKSLKKKKNNLMIALCGCMMQEDTVIDTIKKSYNHVDIIFGTHNIYKLAELIKAKLETKDMIIDIWEAHKEIVEDLPSIRKHKFKASVNIMYGCNNFCSYCIVPYVRGRERSRAPEDILSEIKALVADGVVEIMLLGQNVNSYGQTLDQSFTFANLLEALEDIEGLERIRFMTSHPKDLSDDLIKVMGQSKKICNQLHLPLQSGSTKILNEMNRKYTKEDYLELVKKIKAARPDIALTTDIIVGFPGETKEDFEETLEVVKAVEYINAYTFIYSKRTGTPAAKIKEQLPESVVKERFNQLIDTLQPFVERHSQEKVGKTYKVLIEEVNQQEKELVSGRLSSNHLVHLKGDKSLIGKIIDVKITSAMTFYLRGEQV